MLFRLLLLLSRLPVAVLYAFSSVLAVLLYFVVRYRRSTVSGNLLLAFPGLTDRQRLAIERDYYRHLADVAVETLMLASFTPAQLAGRVEIIGLEHLRECVEKGESALLLSAHQGNWEWMLTAVAAVSPCPLDALYRPLHQRTMDELFLHIRTRFNAHMVPAEKAARVILKLRKQVRAFGILGDQNPRRRDEKYWANFMGIRTPVVIGPERIARLTAYPLFYVATVRTARGRYRCTIEPLARPPYGEDGSISQLYMDAVEKHLRAQPACWMWSHQRWRYRWEDSLEYQRENPTGKP